MPRRNSKGQFVKGKSRKATRKTGGKRRRSSSKKKFLGLIKL